MNRLSVFKEKCSTEFHCKKLALKISEAEFDLAVGFIEDNDHLGHLEFEYAVNRMFLDKPEKPKNWAVICELLMLTNTAWVDSGKNKR